MGAELRRDIPAYGHAKGKVDDLAFQTGEIAYFAVREQNEVVYAYAQSGHNAAQTGIHTGHRLPIHNNAVGKAILANLPTRTRSQVLDSHELVSTGPNTITEASDLEEELETVARKGYATNIEESTEGVNGLGTVIEDRSETIIGAVGVAGPATRITPDYIADELVDDVLSAANEIELRIRHGGPGFVQDQTTENSRQRQKKFQ